jgi:imidazolonepropionase-like amidohydrolase
VRILIENGIVVDGTGGPPASHASVLVEDGIIREAGDAVGDAAPDVRIDASGKSVLPGLIDLHTHLCLPMNPYEGGARGLEPTPDTLALAAINAVNNARLLISMGVTTVRDCGSHGHGIFTVRTLIETGSLQGPRIVACGRAITMTGGHCAYLGVEADGVDAVRKAARVEMRAGAQALKLMASGAGAEAEESPYDIHLSEAELRAAVDEAHARGITACAHAVNPQAVRNAVNAGIDSIEHGVLLDEASLELMCKNGVAFVPTLWTFQMTAAFGAVFGTKQSVVEELRRRVQVHLDAVRIAHRLGVLIGAGTDSALPVNPPESVIWEIAWLSYCGLSNVEAIRAATGDAARILHLQDEVGTLQPGRVGDVLIVDGDVTTDLAALLRTSVVIKAGHVVIDAKSTAPMSILRGDAAPPGPLPPGFNWYAKAELVTSVDKGGARL